MLNFMPGLVPGLFLLGLISAYDTRRLLPEIHHESVLTKFALFSRHAFSLALLSHHCTTALNTWVWDQGIWTVVRPFGRVGRLIMKIALEMGSSLKFTVLFFVWIVIAALQLRK